MQLLVSMAENIGLPRDFESYMFTFIQREDNLLTLLGHPPEGLIKQALREPGLPEKLLINQEEMHDYVNAKSYDLWPFQGQVKSYSMSLPLGDALRQSGVLKAEPTREPVGEVSPTKPESAGEPKNVSPVILPTVLAAGLVDGINPCAFAVMAFFTALLFALRRTRQQVMQMGAAYIVGMYITYFGLGLGLLRALTLLGQPHVITQIGGAAVILLGLIQVKDGLFPKLPLHLTMPKPAWEMAQSWARRTSLPAAFVLGGLVGLCTLPCSGGIYVAILGLLTSQVSYTAGLGYLSLYNLMFIVPLVVILLFVSSRPVSLALAGWERRNTQTMHLGVGAAMVALGLFMLLWLI